MAQRSQLSIWELIAPAIPDSIEDLGNGHYLAKWWKPVPIKDVMVLRKSKAVVVHGEPFEPKSLPEGIAVHFSLGRRGESDDAIHVHPRFGSARRSKEPLKKTAP